MTLVVTASDLKNNTSDYLNRIKYEKVEIIIERHGEQIARLVPISSKKRGQSMDEAHRRVNKNLSKSFGSLPNLLAPDRGQELDDERDAMIGLK